MSEGAEGAAQRRQSAGRRSRQSSQKRSSADRVTLEKVLGISVVSSSSLATDPNSGLTAYPAGCVIVLLHPKKNKQTHIINTSRKPFTAVAFSHDGKHLVTGESGHMPCVRVWEVGGAQVAEVQSHKYGVSCVAFSTNSSYIVSVGFQHDMTVSVWDWRKGSVIATSKVSSRVHSVSFSQDNSYFVTAGNRHVKFWYLDASRERRVNSTVPLIGRSGLLGEHRNSVFSGVACGRGLMAPNVYCITGSGLLCLFSSSSRQLDAWVDLKTSSSSCLSLSEDFIFCGCADGVVRVFSPSNLQYLSTLQRPHRLGVDLTKSAQHGALPASPGARYPDTLALTFDPRARLLTCVYDDHSVYVWDVRDVRSAARLYSTLFHSSCVWGVEVYPELRDVSEQCLPPSSFLTCSSDNTIRLWNTEQRKGNADLYSNDLLRILYVGDDTQHLQAEAAGANGKAGIRALGVSPDGRHLAAGDRCGNLRIFSLEFLDELMRIEAHDSEVLCLEFSPSFTGVNLLASASRDRLIHVFNVEKNFSLEQTLNDHSASVTAVKWTGSGPAVRMVSCGADKSVYFQSAEQTAEGLRFARSRHVVEKSTLNDMDLDRGRAHVAVACQDRNVRVYNVETGKLKKCLRGSSGDEGALLKVQMDPSGSFFATSCSDKNINVFDYESGECVATLFGHSGIVTCMRFSEDCRHLITVSGDSCVFVWRLDAQMCSAMRRRRGLRPNAPPPTRKQANIRRETFITGPCCQLPQTEEEEEEEEQGGAGTPDRSDPAPEAQLLQTNGKLPMWVRKLQAEGKVSPFAVPSEPEPRQVRSRWAEQLDPPTICSASSPSPTKSHEEEEEEEEEEDFHPQSLDSLLVEEEEVLQTGPRDQSSFIVQPDTRREPATPDPQLEVSVQGAEPVWSTQLSPDSACSEGSTGSQDQQQDADTDSLSQGSSVGSLGLEDEDDRNSLKSYFDALTCSLSDEKFDTDPKTLRPPDQKHFLNPRLSISTRFLSRFQDRLRGLPGRVLPPAAVAEESRNSGGGDASVSWESSGSSQRRQNNAAADVTGQRSLAGRRSCGATSHQPRRRAPRRRHTTMLIMCRRTPGDVAPKAPPTLGGNIAAPPVQQGATELGHLETPASLSRDASSTSTSIQEENRENLPCSSSSSSSGLEETKPDTHQGQTSSPQAVVPPTLVMSQGGVSRCSVSSVDVTPTNQNRTLTQSPSPSQPPINPCDIISHLDPQPAAADWSVAAPPDSSPPPPERLRPPPTGDACDDVAAPPSGRTVTCADEEPVSEQQCERVADQLKEATRRAIRLYQQLSGSSSDSERRTASVVRDALDAARAELRAALGHDGAPCGRPQDDGTRLLLEQYSELLLQLTRDKLKQL